MYGLAEHEDLRQLRKEIRHEAAVEHQASRQREKWRRTASATVSIRIAARPR